MYFKSKNWIFVVLLTINLSIHVYADKRYCLSIANISHYRKYCYNTNTYNDCKTTCKNAVIDQQHKDQDCPWGDAPNARGCNQINNLTSGFYCLRHHLASPNLRLINQVRGMNCCGSCMDTTRRTAPNKANTWRNQYPGLY